MVQAHVLLNSHNITDRHSHNFTQMQTNGMHAIYRYIRLYKMHDLESLRGSINQVADEASTSCSAASSCGAAAYSINEEASASSRVNFASYTGEIPSSILALVCISSFLALSCRELSSILL
ncbi:hypothetical protein HanIR_Chr17g0873341 [Helianthus annuus]|nr:hypothetical protein HanIR_Chr17g0873341 [Helianthus annuus]